LTALLQKVVTSRILVYRKAVCVLPATAPGDSNRVSTDQRVFQRQERSIVPNFARAAAFAVLVALCCGVSRVDARPNTSGPAVEAYETAYRLAALNNGTESGSSDISTKWAELQRQILADRITLAGCRSGVEPCPAAAQRFLSIVELGRQREGRARLGQINRAVNLSIRPVSDLVQYGVDDFWAAPLTTLRTGAGDCEDYAIVKYLALREVGIAPVNIRLMIVRDVRRQTNHAVVAVRHEGEWLILDNRTMVIVRAIDAQNYWPLFSLDERGVGMLATASLSN
jgi:predicted transglutaminase-like cysteine proteinase